MNQFRGLIFDVDGTMAETEELHRRAFNESFAHFGLDWVWDQDLYRKLLLVTGGKERISHFQCERADENARLDAARIAELHRFKTARYAELVAGGGCPLRPGVADIISSARSNGQALAIATTTSRGNVDALLTPAARIEVARAVQCDRCRRRGRKEEACSGCLPERLGRARSSGEFMRGFRRIRETDCWRLNPPAFQS